MSYAKPDWSADGDPYGIKPETSLPIAKIFWLLVLLLLLAAVAYLVLAWQPVQKTLLLMPTLEEPDSFGPIPFRETDVDLVTGQKVFGIVDAQNSNAPDELCQHLVNTLTPANPCGILYIKAFAGVNKSGLPVIWQSKNEHLLSKMLQPLQKLDADETMIVVLDCCHSNVESSKQMFGNSFVNSFQGLLENSELPENVWFLFAAENFELSYPAIDFSSSEFATAFASGCNGSADTFEPEGNADGVVTFNELLEFIRKQTHSQSPVLMNFRGDSIKGAQQPEFVVVSSYARESQTSEEEPTPSDTSNGSEEQVKSTRRLPSNIAAIFARSPSSSVAAFLTPRQQKDGPSSSGDSEINESEPADDSRLSDNETDDDLGDQNHDHDSEFWTQLGQFRRLDNILRRVGNSIIAGPVVTAPDKLRSFEKLLIERDFRSRFGARVGEDSQGKLQDLSRSLSSPKHNDVEVHRLGQLEDAQSRNINNLINAWQVWLNVDYDLAALVRLNDWLLTARKGNTAELNSLLDESSELRMLLSKTSNTDFLTDQQLGTVSVLATTVADAHRAQREKGRKRLNELTQKRRLISMVEAYAYLQSPFLDHTEKASLCDRIDLASPPSVLDVGIFSDVPELLGRMQTPKSPQFIAKSHLPNYQPSPRIALKPLESVELGDIKNSLALRFELSGSYQPGDALQLTFALDGAKDIHLDPSPVKQTKLRVIESRLDRIELAAEAPATGNEIVVPLAIAWNDRAIRYYRAGDVKSPPRSLPLKLRGHFQADNAPVMEANINLTVPSRNRMDLKVTDLSDLPGTQVAENSLQKDSLASIPQKLRMFSNRTTQYAFSIMNDTKDDQRVRVIVSAVARPSGSTWPRGYLYQKDPRIDDFELYSSIASELKEGLRVPKKFRGDELSSCDIDLRADGRWKPLLLQNQLQEGSKAEVTDGLVVEYLKMTNRGTEEQPQWELDGTSWPAAWIELSEIHPRDLFSCTASWDANQRSVLVTIDPRSDDWEIPAGRERPAEYRMRVSNERDILEYSSVLSANAAENRFSDVSYSERDRRVLIDIDGYSRAFTLSLPCRRDENATASEVIDNRMVSFSDARIRDVDERVKVVAPLTYTKTSPWSSSFLGAIEEPPQNIEVPFNKVWFHGKASRSVEVSLQIDLPRNASPRNRLGDRVHITGRNGLRLADDEFATGPAIDATGLNRDRRVAAFWGGVNDEGGVQVQSIVRDYKLYIPRTGDNTIDVIKAEIRQQADGEANVRASDQIAVAFDSTSPIAAPPEISKRRVLLNAILSTKLFEPEPPPKLSRERIREVAWRVTETVSGNIREKVELKKIAWPKQPVEVELPTDSVGSFEVEVYWTDVVGNQSKRVRGEYEVVKPLPKPKPKMKKKEEPPPEMGVIRLNITQNTRRLSRGRLRVTAFGETKETRDGSVQFDKKTLLNKPVTVQFEGTLKNRIFSGSWQVMPVKDDTQSRTVDVTAPTKPNP